jgi:uncharacterized protein DUF3450
VNHFRSQATSVWRPIVVAAVVVLFGAPAAVRAGVDEAPAPAENAGGPASARTLLAKWMETERIIAQERAEWQHSRDMLRARIDLVNSEIQAQQEKTKQLHDAAADLGAKRATLLADDQAAQSALDALDGYVGDLEAGLRGLSARFPEPLRARVKPLLDRMPADPAHTRVSLAERFQNIVGILNEANKFDNDISMNAEVRTLSDGKPAEVRVVYVGLGQAYFVSAKGEAGVGRPGPDGWLWEADPTIAPAVAQVVEILLAKSKPKLVPLPVSLQ